MAGTPKGSWRLKLEVEDTGILVHEVEELGNRAWDAKPVLRRIQEDMAMTTISQFASQGGRSGERWKPDEKSTVERKVAEGYSSRTEMRTGTLAASLLFHGPGNIHRLSKASTTFGTRVFYAVFQGHARRLLAITMGDADRWSDWMLRWVLHGELP
jgi:hypothetical protein